MEFTTTNLILAACLDQLGFSPTSLEATPNGIHIFKYNVSESAKEEMERWAALFFSSNLFVSPEKFLISYKELKYQIYEKRSDDPKREEVL